ncbi:SpoU_methylase domain-containing protein [Haematococcus lacustris]|uniref:SpoU_methylase domain-containing protein n=1 Tax=Haematococcus lacustris TaxID=44745 RepID=A0A6A0A616_HAELA|nr:SpoU_methylase domain-containing protein [Haematococcus lacustris]
MGGVLVEGLDGLSHSKRRQEIRRRLLFSRAASQWLDVRYFWSVEACVAALQEGGWTIWATDLSTASELLCGSPGAAPPPLPHKLAVVMGREADGVSRQMLAAAHRRVYLPMFGMSASLNVMVATGMVLNSLFNCWPEARGGMEAERKQQLRREW